MREAGGGGQRRWGPEGGNDGSDEGRTGEMVRKERKEILLDANERDSRCREEEKRSLVTASSTVAVFYTYAGSFASFALTLCQ